MFIKLTVTATGDLIRQNFDHVVDYKESSQKGTSLLIQGEESYLNVNESTVLIDCLLGVKTVENPNVLEITEDTLLKEMKGVMIAGRDAFRGLHNHFTWQSKGEVHPKETKEPTMKDVIELVLNGKIRSIRNMGKKTVEELTVFLSDNFPQYKF